MSSGHIADPQKLAKSTKVEITNELWPFLKYCFYIIIYKSRNY